MTSNHFILSHPLLFPSPVLASVRVFPTSQLFPSGGKSVGQHQSFQWIFSVYFLEDWLVWFPCCPRDSQESSPAPQLKASILWCSTFFMVQISHLYVATGKTICLTIWTSVSKVMTLFFNMLPRFVIDYFPRSKHLLTSWLHTICSDFWSPREENLSLLPLFSLLFVMTWWNWHHDLSFWMLNFKPAFSLTSFILTKRIFSSFILSPIRVVSSAYLRSLIFLLAILIPACASSSSAFYMM